MSGLIYLPCHYTHQQKFWQVSFLGLVFNNDGRFCIVGRFGADVISVIVCEVEPLLFLNKYIENSYRCNSIMKISLLFIVTLYIICLHSEYLIPVLYLDTSTSPRVEQALSSLRNKTSKCSMSSHKLQTKVITLPDN